MPVTAELQGMATIGGKTGELKMTIDYANFQEVEKLITLILISKRENGMNILVVEYIMEG